MEIILVVVAGVLLVAMTGLYMYLVDKNKIEPHYPTTAQRGNFWDAETKKFYKWDELMELKKEREEQNDRT
jgi:flagellar basal body-associated protein FliL